MYLRKMRIATVILILLCILFSGCRKDRLEDYTGSYTATRAGQPGTFTIEVRNTGSNIALGSTFGTFPNTAVITGTFHSGSRKHGSTAKLFSEIEQVPLYHTGSASETNIGGHMEFSNRKRRTFELTLSISPCSETEGGLRTEMVQISAE